MSQRPGPAALAKQRGKPHCFFKGGKWHAVTPGGYVGWGTTPDVALATARFRDALVQRVVGAKRGFRGTKQTFGAPRVWLVSDPDAPAANMRIVC